MHTPLIEQVKLQAQALVPLVRALQAELGEERANAIVRKGLGELFRKYGEKWWRAQEGRDLGEKVSSAFEMFAAGDALDYEVVRKTPDALDLNVTGCRYAEFYKKIGAPELGFLLTCSADADFFHPQGFGAGTRLTVTQTIMQGASHCDFRFSAMRIERDDLSRPEIHALLQEHLDNMHELSPPESIHALDLTGLRGPDITFWSVWDGTVLVGCGALKELTDTHGEVKSMRTPKAIRRRGAGRAVLKHIIAEARSRGYRRLSLETGSHEAFKPAQRLYADFGFALCGPFAEYKEDPHSVFMTLEL
jgi:putative acetyltransferase